jgi:hypothetical protein
MYVCFTHTHTHTHTHTRTYMHIGGALALLFVPADTGSEILVGAQN